MSKLYRQSKLFLKKTIKISCLLVICLMIVEFGLRGFKSITYDAVLHLSSPSINSESHPQFGWISPSSFSYEKDDPCYGKGRITYNSDGFRAPPMELASQADIIVCILGDSTIHGYQMPDGIHLPYLLTNELKKYYASPYVLPLAVGGYGTAQQFLLFEKFCQPLGPDLVISHWCDNDIINNDYELEKNSLGNNNMRKRPYFEEGRFVFRRPYPVQISDSLDHMMVIKTLNLVVMKATLQDHQDSKQAIKNGWRVAEILLGRIAGSVPVAISLVSEKSSRAIELYRSAGFHVATHPDLTTSETCMPRDPHANHDGHQKFLQFLMPAIKTTLKLNLKQRRGLRQTVK